MKKTTLISSMMMVALLVSCNHKLDIPVVSEGDTISVPLSLSVSSMENGFGEDPSAYTKAGSGQDDRIQDTGDGTNTPIKNVFVLQFDGITDASKLVSWSYVGNYTTGSDIELKATDVENRIVFLANTFSPATRFPLGMTVAELKTYSIKNVLDSKGVFGAEEVSDGNFLYYPMFSGDIIVAKVEAGTVLTCTLKRNIARINVTVVNEAAGTADNIQITSVKLKSVPGVSVNYTNYDYDAENPDFSAFPTANFPADGSFKTIDYEPMNWDAEGAATQTFTFYAPLNLRGTITNTDEKQKNTLAPATATRCEVTATYKSGDNNYPVTYTFVLGADMISDCNLLPNKSYSYTFTIKQKGNPDIDPRVEDWGPVDFTPSTTPRSNCYILNPPSASGMTRKFLIPIDRVREFWGNNGYENDLTRAMMGEHQTETWTAKILWSDFKIENDNLKLTKSTGTGSLNQYFEVEVAGGVSGNAVVALYLGEEDIIWSWHLWITDYNPDYASRKKIVPEPENGKYIYDVPGGAVHSYNTAPFKTGICKGRFIMDRNLGAMNTINPNGGMGSIFYQFGRKDPFNISTLYKPDGTTVKFSTITWNSGEITQETSKIGKNVPYSIQNPLKFITGSSTWTTGDIYCPIGGGEFLWQDPKSAPSADGKAKKSIFDPCPSGWMVPVSGTWDGLTTGNCPYDKSRDDGYGLHYYPDKATHPDDYIFYPATGFIGENGLFSGGAKTYAYYLSCSPISSSAVSFYFLYTNTSYFSTKQPISRAQGNLVRCIQEYF